jgi:hypothetical protein
MVRHRRQANPLAEESSSSDDEEDAFSALSQKNKKKEPTTAKGDNVEAGNNATESSTQQQLPTSTTSSNKRHHKPNDDSRKAKMDALLQELEVEKSKRPISIHDRNRGFVPHKTGSFVDPGEEHLTTNIFVGKDRYQ